MKRPTLHRSHSTSHNDMDDFTRPSKYRRRLSSDEAECHQVNRASTNPFIPPLPIPPLKVLRQVPEARLPVRGSSGAAGYDLHSVEEVTIAPQARCLVNTGLIVKVPPGTYGRIAPRSGLALNHFIDVGAGVIDEDYRGVLKVILFNFNDTTFQVKVGDRIAQLILEKIATPSVVETCEMERTWRGARGFGSTGIV